MSRSAKGKANEKRYNNMKTIEPTLIKQQGWRRRLGLWIT